MYWLTGIVGMVFFFAPFMFGYAANTGALWTSLLIGLATIAVSWIEGTKEDKEQWEYWTAGVLGLVAVVAPFILGFSAEITAMWTSIVAGALLAFFAGSRLTSRDWRHV